MTDHAELRRLAKAATPGEWRVQTGCSWRRIGTDNGDGDVLRPCTHPHDGWPDIAAPVENLEYIAAANPKTILALLDEIDRLKAENEALRKIISECATACGAGCAPECTLEFMSMLPGEISSVVSRRAAAEIGKSMGGGE